MRQVEDLVARGALAPGPAHPLLREQDGGVRPAGRRQAVKCLWHSGFSAPSLPSPSPGNGSISNDRLVSPRYRRPRTRFASGCGSLGASGATVVDEMSDSKRERLQICLAIDSSFKADRAQVPK